MVGALCLWSRRKENIVAKSIFQVRPITNNKYTMYINSFICLHLNVEMKPMDNNTYSAICCAWYGYGYGTYFFRLKHSNIAMDQIEKSCPESRQKYSFHTSDQSLKDSNNLSNSHLCAFQLTTFPTVMDSVHSFVRLIHTRRLLKSFDPIANLPTFRFRILIHRTLQYGCCVC